MKQIVINTHSWKGISPNAEHIYATVELYETDKEIYDLVDDQPSPIEQFDLLRKINQKEADYLNKKEGGHSWRAGDKTHRYNSYDEIKESINNYLIEEDIEADVVILKNWEKINDTMFIINRKPKELKPTEQKIKITVCQAFGPQFENLIPDSIHDVIETPARHKNSEMKGVWVMGIGEPVKVLNDEYTQIK